MKHLLNLNDKPFQAIKNKTKTIEMRLYDEKRKQIKVGDTIVFTNVSTNETLVVEVTETTVYGNFAELYSCYDKVLLGYQENEVANPDDMLLFYSNEKITQCGVLAIGVKVISG